MSISKKFCAVRIELQTLTATGLCKSHGNFLRAEKDARRQYRRTSEEQIKQCFTYIFFGNFYCRRYNFLFQKVLFDIAIRIDLKLAKNIQKVFDKSKKRFYNTGIRKEKIYGKSQ